MNEKNIVKEIIALLIIGLIILNSGCISQPDPEKVNERFSEFEIQLNEKRVQGYDVTEAEEFLREAEQAFNKKNYRKANKLLDNGFEALKYSRMIAFPGGGSEEYGLFHVKSAILYESVTDGIDGRTIDDVNIILNETKTDFIFRGFWRYFPVPESPETVLPSEYDSEYVKISAQQGYTYQQLREAITEIKKENPDIILCGAIPAQSITTYVWNPITGEYLGQKETWDMALDPTKWEIDYSKNKLQCELAKQRSWVSRFKNCDKYDYEEVDYYFPDITNEKFQGLFLSWAKKQIDSGADAIWIDLLYSQAGILKTITNDPNHPAVTESFESSSKMVDEIHKYGLSKGRYIYVGSWPTSTMYPYSQPKLDFVTLTLSTEEVNSIKFNEKRIDNQIINIENHFGDIPIFIFLDWGGNIDSPLGVYSQKLSKNDQKEFLIKAEEFYQNKNIIFIYPVHGGGMGVGSKKLSYGKYKVYDSLAPEFESYSEIIRTVQN